MHSPGQGITHIDQDIEKTVAVSHVIGFIDNRCQRIQTHEKQQHSQGGQKDGAPDIQIELTHGPPSSVC